MRILPKLGGSVPCLLLLVSVLFSATLSFARVVEVVGYAESKSKNPHAFSGLRVTIECKVSKGHFVTKGSGNIDEEGKFGLKIPPHHDIVSDEGVLKEKCYAQLHSAAGTPCPAHDGLEANEIVFLYNSGDKHVLGLKQNLKFSPQLCVSKFFWPMPPFKGFDHHFPFPKFKKPCPPPVPVYDPPPKVELPPPVPVHDPPPKVELPPPVPKKPCPPKSPKIEHPPPVPVHKPPPKIKHPSPVPVHKPPPKVEHPPPVPVHKPPTITKKPCPPKPPKKELPPPVQVHKPPPKKSCPPKPPKKVDPPPVPVYKPPPKIEHPPIYVPPVVIPKKPCPPLPKFPPLPPKYIHHPKFGKWPPLPTHP